ncbi:MAG: diguanylate cyclase [Campylobacterota bacterium]|nr:diguanylate cyclase [Campylobacterota bacterium]
MQLNKNIDFSKFTNSDIDFFISNKNRIIETWINEKEVLAVLTNFKININKFKFKTASSLFDYLINVLLEKSELGRCPTIEALINILFKKNLHLEDVFILCSNFKNTFSLLMYQENIPTEKIKLLLKILDINLHNTLKLFTDKLHDKDEILKRQKQIIEDHVLLTTTNPKGVITHTTDAFCKLSGFSKEEMIGQSHRIMKDPNLPKEFFTTLWETVLAGKTWESNVRNIAKDGTLFVVKTKIIPVKDKNGEIIQLMAIRDDITDKEKAKYDSLTNIFTRGEFDKKFAILIEEAKHNNTELSIIVVDADHFKKVNDTYGHQKGDEVLVDIAKVLTNNIRGNDICARWGGEEFVVLLPGSSIEVAKKIANRMRENISSYIKIDNQAQTCSFGISSLQENDTENTLFKKADEALYNAKSNGRDRVELKLNS